MRLWNFEWWMQELNYFIFIFAYIQDLTLCSLGLILKFEHVTHIYVTQNNHSITNYENLWVSELKTLNYRRGGLKFCIENN